MKKRVVGYDIIKSMAMFFVVMLHYSFYTRFYSSGLAGTAVTVLCVVCVPLFFAVNGALLLPRKMDEAKHYRKTLNIVIVVTIWRLLAAAFFVFVDGSHPVTLKDLVLFLLGGGFGDYPTGYFWFMNALIAVYLVLPVMKMAFDSERKLAFNALLAVLAGFTVGKDSLKLVLQMLGTATNHDFASILNALDEFYIFGSYGYVLLYFLIGGMIGRYLKQKQTGELDADVHHPLFDISWGEASAGIVVCYALTLLIQRYQHATHGTNLTVENGYWLLPSFVATILILLVLGAGEYPRHLGQSIPGDRHEHVRRVHAASGRIGAVEQITGSTMAPVHGKLEFRCSDFAECGVVRLRVRHMSCSIRAVPKDPVY